MKITRRFQLSLQVLPHYCRRNGFHIVLNCRTLGNKSSTRIGSEVRGLRECSEHSKGRSGSSDPINKAMQTSIMKLSFGMQARTTPSNLWQESMPPVS